MIRQYAQIFTVIRSQSDAVSFTSVKDAAESAGITRETLRKHLKERNKYDKNDILIFKSELIKVKGRGNKNLGQM